LFELLAKTRTELEDNGIDTYEIAICAKKEGYADWANATLDDAKLQPFPSGRIIHIDHIRRKP
jgi:hypothetical protein